MDGADATGNGYLGSLEDGVGGGGQLGPDPVFRLPGFQMNHPDLGEVLQHGAGRQFFQLLLRSYDPKERYLKAERQEADLIRSSRDRYTGRISKVLLISRNARSTCHNPL